MGPSCWPSGHSCSGLTAIDCWRSPCVARMWHDRVLRRHLPCQVSSVTYCHVHLAGPRCPWCCPGVAVITLGRPPHRARGGHDLLVGDMSGPDHPDADFHRRGAVAAVRLRDRMRHARYGGTRSGPRLSHAGSAATQSRGGCCLRADNRCIGLLAVLLCSVVPCSDVIREVESGLALRTNAQKDTCLAASFVDIPRH
jgi:hypothetical protein